MNRILIVPDNYWIVMCKSKIKALIYLYKLLKNDNVKEITISKGCNYFRYIKR